MSANAATQNSVPLERRRDERSARSGKVTSADGTRIAYTRVGEGPPLILVDGALCSRSMGPMTKLAEVVASHFTVFTYDRRGRGESGDVGPYSVGREIEDLEALIAHAGGSALVCGTSSGAAIGLEAARSGAAIEKLAIHEAPFIVDDTHAPQPDGWAGEVERLVIEGRRGEAVMQFLRFVGMPAVFAALMRLTPVWSKLKMVAHTLPYDISIVADYQRGVAFTAGEWDGATIPTIVLVGSKSPAWMRSGMEALACALPDAQHRLLAGQTHMFKPRVVGPELVEFFLG